jgi:RHS repeat-associated protein
MYDTEGEKTWDAVLDIYGRVLTFAGRSLSECPFRYQGQYQDSETGLYYNRFRYYDAEVGSYISKDPIGLAGGNPTLYGYVKDVNSWADVLGLDCGNLSNGKKIKDLIDTGDIPDRNGFTKVGRAQQKHSSRAGSVFDKPSTGQKPIDFNTKGRNSLSNILNNENSIKPNRYGGFDVWDSTGKGARFDGTDSFIGFLEP